MASFDNFRNLANTILALDAATLERRLELGSQLYFERAPQIVTTLQHLLRSVNDKQSHLVPDRIWEENAQQLVKFSEITDEIARFNPQQVSPVDQRNQLESDLQIQYYCVFSNLSLAATVTIIASESLSHGDRFKKIELEINDRFNSLATRTERDLSTATEQMQLDLQKATLEGTEAAKSINILLEETRNSAAEVISTREAKHFQLATEDFEKSAKRWLKVTISGVLVLFIMATISLYVSSVGLYDDLKAASIAQIGLSKLLLFGIVGYVTSQAAKNFFAAKHNEAVNKHRQNAILAYRALVEATGSPEHRDIVLTHAAAAVFAPQDTAFIKGQGGGTELPATFINSVTKAVAPAH